MNLLGYSLSVLFTLAGAALIIAEALVPGAHFIVLGIAIFGAGVAGILLPASMVSPGLLAALTLVFGVGAYYVYSRFDFYGTGGERTRDSDSLVGAEGVVTDTVTPSSGTVKLNETAGFTSTFSARVEYGELDEDTPVIVVDGRGGNVLTVEELPEN